MISTPTKLRILAYLKDAEEVFEEWVGSEESIESINSREPIIAIAAMIQAEVNKCP